MDEASNAHATRRAALRSVGLLLASSLSAACGGSSGAREPRRETNGGPAPDGSGNPSRTSDAGATPSTPDAQPESRPETGSSASDAAADACLPPSPPKPRPLELLDIHAHFVPEAYKAAAEQAGYALGPRATWSRWSLDEHLALADGLGVAVSVLSLPAPGVHFGDDAAALALARAVNDEAAMLVSRSPSRLRFLACLPLPDVEGALAEWQRVASLKGCVGAAVYAHARGMYLGDPQLDPLWKALNDASSTVLVHPQAPEPTAGGSMPLEQAASLTRATMGMFTARVITRHASIRFVLANCGGILPGVLDRIQTFGLAGYTISADQTKQELAQLFFDCAGAVLGTQLPALLRHVPIARVLYGSDSGADFYHAIVAQRAAFDAELDAAPGEPLAALWRANGRAFALP